MKHPIVTDTNRNAKSWQQLIAGEASRRLNEHPSPTLVAGPVVLGARFYLPRPKAYERRRGVLVHTKKPDLDKLLRAVLDALTGVVFGDDSQVVEIHAAKRYTDGEEIPHAVITVNGIVGEAVAAPPLFREVTP